VPGWTGTKTLRARVDEAYDCWKDGAVDRKAVSLGKKVAAGQA
jgi:hypothetical protein